MSRIYQSKPNVAAAAPTPSSPSSKSPSPAPAKNDGSGDQQSYIDPKQYDRMEKLVSRLESIAMRLENTPIVEPSSMAKQQPVAPVAVTQVNVPSINAFDDLINGTLKSFVDLSNQIGGDVKSIVSVLFLIKKE